MKPGDLVRLKVIPSRGRGSLSVEVIWRARDERPVWAGLSESGREFKRGTPALFLHFDTNANPRLANTWALIFIEGRVGWVSADDIESL